MSLSAEDKEFLLKVARETVTRVVGNQQPLDYQPVSEVTAQHRGAFVTLRKRGQLRGCVGLIEGLRPLVETVRDMAVSAAVHDIRFNPVSEDELDELEIEISAMSPITPVDDVAEIQLGRDGLIIRHGGRQGLLLPQVATEYGWDRNTFLEQTCRKAGLPPDAWKMKGTEIRSFSAEVFGEKDRL